MIISKFLVKLHLIIYKYTGERALRQATFWEFFFTYAKVLRPKILLK